jgi:hypothetical protein
MRLRPLQGPTQRGPPTSIHPPLRRATKSSKPATLMEFFSPSTHQPERVYSTPACHTDYVPSSGFLTLSTAFSSLERPALFHAGNVHGVSLSRGFPSLSGPSSSSPGGLPSWRFSSALHSKLRNARALASPQTQSRAHVTSLFHLQGFTPTANPYRRWTITSNANGRSPPELSPPLQGLAFAFRPRRASVSHSCASFVSPSNGPPRDKPETNLGKAEMRFSGFARKRRIPLRRAKYPFLRFLQPSHVMYPS